MTISASNNIRTIRMVAGFTHPVVERAVPDAGSLAHAVDTLHELHHPIFLAFAFEGGRNGIF